MAAAGGATTSTTLATAQTPALATATRSRPTSTGRAPKLAPSKNVNTACAQKATTRTCQTVSASSHQASGIEPMSTAFTRSLDTMTRWRSQRSVSAPATRPKSRYGSASRAVTDAVSRAEPLSR